jgi:hypothetical protein
LNAKQLLTTLDGGGGVECIAKARCVSSPMDVPSPASAERVAGGTRHSAPVAGTRRGAAPLGGQS